MTSNFAPLLVYCSSPSINIRSSPAKTPVSLCTPVMGDSFTNLRDSVSPLRAGRVRDLPGQAAAAQPPVTADDDEDSNGECDEEVVLDVADLVPVDHEQQKRGDHDEDHVPHPRRGAAPAPLGSRHVLDVYPAVSYNLGAGHGAPAHLTGNRQHSGRRDAVDPPVAAQRLRALAFVVDDRWSVAFGPALLHCVDVVDVGQLRYPATHVFA